MPRSQHGDLVRFVQSMQGAFAGFGLIMPGARGKKLRMLAQVEQALSQLKEDEAVLERIYDTASVLVKNVKVTNSIMAGIQRMTGEYQEKVERLDSGIQARLREAQQLQEQAMQVQGREKRVGERETNAEQLLRDLNNRTAEVSALEHGVKAKLDETVSLGQQVSALEDKVSGQQANLADGLTALQQRREKMDQFKLQLQNREEAVTKSLNQLADLAQQKKVMQKELADLKRQTQEELDRSDALARERELNVADREAEMGSMGMVLMERERALHEREKMVETREGEVAKESTSLQKTREDILAQEQRIAGLEATIESLESQRDQLNRAIASLSAKL